MREHITPEVSWRDHTSASCCQGMGEQYEEELRLFSYFIDSVATDGESLCNLKSCETYQFSQSNKVRRIL